MEIERLTAEEKRMILYNPGTTYFSMPAFVFEKYKATAEEAAKLRAAIEKHKKEFLVIEEEANHELWEALK